MTLRDPRGTTPPESLCSEGCASRGFECAVCEGPGEILEGGVWIECPEDCRDGWIDGDPSDCDCTPDCDERL